MAGKGMRAYNLATELGLDREELIKKAAEIGIEIRNPMASLDDETVAPRVDADVVVQHRLLDRAPAQDAHALVLASAHQL
jgi:hypothetical protein